MSFQYILTIQHRHSSQFLDGALHNLLINHVNFCSSHKNLNDLLLLVFNATASLLFYLILMKRGKRCPKDFCKINEVFYRNQEQKHPKINIKSFMHITQPRRSVSKFLRWMQHPMKFTLVMSRKMDNGQCVALIIHVSINCHFVALLPQQSVNTLTRHSVCHGDWFPCTGIPLNPCEVPRRISSFCLAFQTLGWLIRRYLLGQFLCAICYD